LAAIFDGKLFGGSVLPLWVFYRLWPFNSDVT